MDETKEVEVEAEVAITEAEIVPEQTEETSEEAVS